ncbi:MAG TPA: endolytic transglycosylase MltG [Pyrinomonadaceae bacterium]|jgi:UPF0755 protein
MKRLRILLVLVVLLLVVCLGVGFWFYQELRTPLMHTQGDQYIEIKRGSSPDEIINRLAETGVIRRGWPLRLYARLTGAGARFKAGEYRFPSPISPFGVVRKLEEGEQRLSRFTVVEGWTRWDIANAMARIPELRLRNADEALALMNDTSGIRDLDPVATNLEGYLFPDTYSFPPDTTPARMIDTMVKRFRKVWEEYVVKTASAKNKSAREVVTVASLIETEAKLKQERPLISSVIYNRIKIGMPLGIDSSVIYASKLAGKWKNDGKVYQSDLDRQSPYNTRKVRGLPPGPIASPGASSLEAALKPADSDYIYYVREPARDDGAHNFYENESDFQRGVQALREWERTRDARARQQTPSEGDGNQ